MTKTVILFFCFKAFALFEEHKVFLYIIKYRLKQAQKYLETPH